MEFNKVSVVGLGYIGLPTAAVLASRGVQVVGVDVNQHAVATINAGGIHIVEPDLDMVVRAAVQSGHLRAVLKPEPADAFVIAVPTPVREGHKPDLAYVEAAGRSIAPALKKGDLVVLESTSPVGTTEKLAAWLAEARPDLSFPWQGSDEPDVNVAYCPERVLPGRVLTELVENDRIVGGMTSRCSERARALYKLFVRGDCLLTTARTAEMAKLTENSFRDVNIAFANELSMICDELRINVWELIALANRHPRVKILSPGPGVGGHCIAVDPWFIVDSAPERARLIRTAREVNDSKPHYVLDQVRALARGGAIRSVACLGLAFKANIDDLRESPAVEIVHQLATEFEGRVIAVEPHIQELPKALASTKTELMSLDQAIAEADAILLLVDHEQFKQLTLAQLGHRPVVDTRGLLR